MRKRLAASETLYLRALKSFIIIIIVRARLEVCCVFPSFHVDELLPSAVIWTFRSVQFSFVVPVKQKLWTTNLNCSTAAGRWLKSLMTFFHFSQETRLHLCYRLYWSAYPSQRPVKHHTQNFANRSTVWRWKLLLLQNFVSAMSWKHKTPGFLPENKHLLKGNSQRKRSRM